MGALGLGIAILLWPGVKRSIEQSEQSQERDWAGFFLPVGLVVLLVIVMIYMSR